MKSANKKMGSSIYKFLIAFAVAGAFCNGHETTQYLHDDDISQDKADWMSDLSDSVKLNEISMAGTHDTMSRNSGWGDAVNCQTLSLPSQLNAGIRVLDIRCVINGNSFDIYHGSIDLGASFDDVLSDIINFLNSHPDEFVLMRIKKESGDDSWTEFERVFDLYYRNSGYSSYFYDVSSSSSGGEYPRVGDVRKKIIILQDFTATKYGIAYNSGGTFNIQDDYSMGTNWDLYSKWTSVKNQLSNANSKGSGDIYYMNYLSGAGGSFPYFVSSGHSSSGTAAPRLSTGLTTPGFKDSYPDFPRVSCFIGICTIAFEGTNVLTYNFLGSYSFVGIIMIDFPGSGLIRSIILKNSDVNDIWRTVAPESEANYNHTISECVNDPCECDSSADGFEDEFCGTCGDNGCTQCIDGSYFKLASNYPCADCQFVFGPNCLSCQDFVGCTSCSNDTYLSVYHVDDTDDTDDSLSFQFCSTVAPSEYLGDEVDISNGGGSGSGDDVDTIEIVLFVAGAVGLVTLTIIGVVCFIKRRNETKQVEYIAMNETKEEYQPPLQVETTA